MNIKDFCTGIQHVGIPTCNIDETIHFYSQLGFDMVYETSNGNERVAFLKMHNLVIETYENGAANTRDGAIDHIALGVQDIDMVFNYIRNLDIKMLDSSINSLPFWDKGVRFFTILGPNEEKIEFCEKIQ